MASIKGLSLKNIKSSRGHDGDSVRKANIYFNDELVGTYAETYMGGTIVDVPSHIRDLFKNYETVMINGDDYQKVSGDIEFAIYDLLDLNDLEKEYKKAVKQTGRSVYIKIRVNWRTTKCYTMPAGNAKYTDHQLIMAIISQAADTEMAKLDQTAFKVIRGMDYFAKA